MYDTISAIAAERGVTAADFAPFIGRRIELEFDDCVDIGCKLVSFNTLLNICDIVDSDGNRLTFPANDLAIRYLNA